MKGERGMKLSTYRFLLIGAALIGGDRDVCGFSGKTRQGLVRRAQRSAAQINVSGTWGSDVGHPFNWIRPRIAAT